MKPQDVLVLLKILTWKGNDRTVARIALSIGMSISETHAAIKRCERSGLISTMTRKPVRSALEEFLIHGLKYCFPAEMGTQDRGMPTAHSAPPLSNMLQSDQDIYVWADPNGNARGITVKPLYRSVPLAASQDQELYEYLSLVDAVRIGRAREKTIAEDMLAEKIRKQDS